MAFWNLSCVCLCAALSIWTILTIFCQRSDALLPDDLLAGYIDNTADRGHHKQGGKMGLKPFPKIVPDNGMFHFVLKDISHELVKLLEEDGLVLNTRHRGAIHDKIESIYERSRDHPALASDLLAFSPKKPDYHQYTPDSVLAAQTKEKREKRGYLGPYAEVCESEVRWETMEFGRMMNYTRAKIFRGVELHTRQCTSDSENHSCLGIDSGLDATGCQTTGSWVQALVCGGCNFEVDSTCNDRCPDRLELFEWEWIYTPTCCKCAYQFRFDGNH